MAEFRDKRAEIIKDYNKANILQQAFIEYFLIDNSVLFVDLIINYPHRFAYINKIPADSVILSPEYYKYRQLKNIVNDKNVISYTYLAGLNNFIVAKGLELMKNGSLKNKNYNPFQIIILDSLKGKTQEFIMARWLCTDLMNSRIDSIIYRKFKEIAQDKLTINTVESAFEKYNQKQALIGKPLNNEFTQTQVEDTLGNVLQFGKLIEKFKGKVVYLDIWHLGCGPCRLSMPYSKKLKEKLSNQPIEFVYLTLDRKYDKLWSNIVKASLTDKNQYRLKDGFDSKFLQFMEINWVPCHMIIDKEGNLIDFNAPRPEEDILENTLLELAAKK